MKYLMPICLLLLVACQQNEPREIAKPTIEWDRTPVVKVGDSIDFEVRQGNGYPGGVHHDWQVAASSLPAGISIQYDGAKIHLVGTPTVVGTYTIPIKVTIGDVHPKSTTRNLVFIVPSTTGPLTIYTPDLPSAYGTNYTGPYSSYYQYSTEIVATGGTNSGYTWSVVGGAAPAGFSVGAWPTGGLIMISLPAPGEYDFTLQVMDSGGNTDTQDLHLLLMPEPLAHGNVYTGAGSGP
ncbi:MAG: hypothetical protein KDB90_05150 [Planctomycetes bacterium]|nr:hypothetical protein [Planctomycetota bacterium]